MEEEQVETLWKSLVKIYKVPPKLVFSIIGDSETFVPKVWPRPIFQTALMEAAKQSDGDTWVLFQGQGNGISSLIWEAFDNYTYLEKQNLSVNEEIKIECFPVKAITLKFGTSAKKVMKSEDHITCTISETKDHFKDARLKFECFIKKQTVSFMKEKVPPKRKTDLELELPVPVLRVLVEGDLNSIVEIVESVKQNIPVVIVKGSGKAANLILNYIEKQESLKSDAALLFGIRFQSKTFEKLKEGLDELRTFEHLINVFDVEKNNAIYFLQVTGEAIVRAWAYAYFKNKEKSDSEGTDKPVAFFSQHVKKKQYQRTLVRDEKDMQFDVMPASLPLFFYFGYQVLQEKGKLIDCGYILQYEALKTNRCDYVKVLVSEGVKFKSTYLAKLYKETFPENEEPKLLFKKDQFVRIKICTDAVLSFTKEPLIKDKADYEYLKSSTKKKQKKNQYKSISRDIRKLCCSLLHHDEPEDAEDADKDVPVRKEEIHMDLLLWAIFANREEIAEYFWMHGQYQLVSSLVCTILLKKLSEMCSDEKEYNLSRRFENHARMFERKASILLDVMYEQNEKHAMDTMDQEVTVFGVKTNPLSFAYENLMYDVLAHPCSQRRMDVIWHKKTKREENEAGCCPSRCTVCDLSPKTYYCINYVMFFVALVLYSGFVLTSVSDPSYKRVIARGMEYSVYIWGFGDFIAEYLPLFALLKLIPQLKFRRFFFKLKLQLNDFWNAIDLLSYIFLAIALIVRHAGSSENLTYSRRIFAVSLLIMYLRFLQAFMMIRTFGATLIMIKEMLKDLITFIWLAIFVIFGVGIYYHANLWPDHVYIFGDGSLGSWRIWKIISLPYWQLYGEPNEEYISGKDQSDCTNITSIWSSDPSQERCPREDWTVVLIAAFYMLFSNLLLVNLVIAMFSYTFGRVKSNSEKLWMFERYVVIKDFEYRKPSLINIICFLSYIISCLFQKCKNRVNNNQGKKETSENKKEEKKDLKKFQKIMATRVVYAQAEHVLRTAETDSM